MKKGIKMAGLITCMSTLVFSMASCLPVFGHTHQWSDWQQSETEHWRYCKAAGCKETERGEHVGYPCEVCGPAFKAVAFYTGINDQAHVSFVHEANKWLSKTAQECNFIYESTNDWSKLNEEFLSDCDLVMFLDTRPEEPTQREAFEEYMENGGAWIGFHFSAFALNNSAYPQNWNWYHNTFLGSGQYVSNTWAPTTAVLQVETHDHCATENLSETFEATACEWYRWENDLRENSDITILASIHPSSFPLGTGPKPEEIWHDGYYPVVWSNDNYQMMYLNMGHNLVTYGDNSQDLSSTFSSEAQNRLLLDAMFGFTRKGRGGK